MLIERTQILKEIKQTVLAIDPKAEVILFGSRARGDFHDESDWDVLILVDKEETDFNFKRKIRNALFELQLKFNEGISTIIRNRDFWDESNATPFFWEIQKDGMVL
jgi:predicted nucleotidyltransferase